MNGVAVNQLLRKFRVSQKYNFEYIQYTDIVKTYT
jgi:hypothetical protein